LPGGFVALLAGTLCGWVLPGALSGVNLNLAGIASSMDQRGLYLPIFCGAELRAALLDQPAEQWLKYLSVIVPMGLFNVIGSMQNIESAAATGDEYGTASSLAANGIGTIAAALFGGCFPTTIYIGHPGWKALGARSGYSTLNGLVITAICLTGTLKLLGAIVPVQAGMPIVFWVGVIITAQAFQVTPLEHAPAVAIGLFPAIAAWGSTVVEGAFRLAGSQTMEQVLLHDAGARANGFLLHALVAVERGSIFTCMILAAIAALLIDRKFFSAAAWSVVAAAFTGLGLMHAFQVVGNDVDYLVRFDRLYRASVQPAVTGYIYGAWPIAAGYLLFAAAFVACGVYQAKRPGVAAH
jgi:AGZA family xanthine/uracil permease-like MFS transporter